MKKIEFSLLIIICSICQVSKAQQTTNVASHSAKISGMSFDYSIGEMMLVSTERTSNLIITQGLLQPDHFHSTGNSGSDGNLTTLDNPIKVYPNPSSHLVFVEMYETSIKDYSYYLYDATGKIVLSRKGQTQVGLNKVELNLQSIASGSYYLIIQKRDLNEQAQNYSFKIQKIK